MKHFPNEIFLLLGTDRKIVEKIKNWSGTSAVRDLVGKTTPREYCLLTARLKAFVGPDSGPAHLASAMGVPTLFLYSGTNDFNRWRPLGQSARVLRHEVSCAPCALDVCRVKGHPCMSYIMPNEVLGMLEQLLRTA